MNGVNFWEDREHARIVHRRVELLDDGADTAMVIEKNSWIAPNGAELLSERRTIAVRALDHGEWGLILELQFEPSGTDEAEFGQTPFGLIGVRMAKSIGVRDGGGRILNSEGQVNEAGCLRKPARWVDYSGPVAPGTTNGITLMDHPTNPNDPNAFHVRDDGWMGVCLTLRAPIRLARGRPLRLRCGLWIHGDVSDPSRIESAWRSFIAWPTAPTGLNREEVLR